MDMGFLPTRQPRLAKRCTYLINALHQADPPRDFLFVVRRSTVGGSTGGRPVAAGGDSGCHLVGLAALPITTA
jgi:hypothetical protein